MERPLLRTKDYIFSRNYIVESAINSASKAAYLSLLIKHGIEEVERFDSKMNLEEFTIEHPDFKKFKTIMNSTLKLITIGIRVLRYSI